jgi:HK97 family phage major capsid protein
MTFTKFIESKGVEDLSAKSAEDLAGLYNEYNEVKRTELENAIEAKATKEDIDSLKAEISNGQLEQVKALNETLKAHGVAIKKLSEKGANETGLLSTVKSNLTEKAADLAALKGDASKKLAFKVAGTMLGSTNVSGGNVPVEQRLPGLDIVPSRRVRLMDIVSRGTADSNVISWVSQANKDGAAGQTAEGALKNQIDFDLVVNQESLKKTTAYIKISEEMLADISFMESEINNELMREILKAVETQVYSGDDSGNNLNGIKTQASAFAAGSFAGTVDNANVADVLTVAANQIRLAEHDAPNYIMLNPSDLTALKLIKTSTTDKRYVDRLVMVAGEMSLDGIPIIETTLVAQDEYLIGDFSKSTVFDKGMVDIKVGYENDDFTKNLVTILAEWRGLNIIKTNQTSAFVTGTISVDAAALETA